VAGWCAAWLGLQFLDLRDNASRFAHYRKSSDVIELLGQLCVDLENHYEVLLGAQRRYLSLNKRLFNFCNINVYTFIFFIRKRRNARA